MRRLDCFVLGFFLLTVRAEKEDFQGYLTEQTKGTAVTKDRPLKKENTIGHGTEAIPTENTHRHTAVALTAKFLGALLFDTRPTQPYERTQITEAAAEIFLPSTEHSESRTGQNSLTLSRENLSSLKIDTKSEIPLISNYGRIIFSPTKASLESMIDGTSEPEVHLPSDAMKALPKPHILDSGNRRNTNSDTLISADRGLGVPILSASHPRVIDNLAALRNDSDDKQSQGEGITNPGRNADVFGSRQSIFQNDTAEDSGRGNAMMNLCLTCLKDQRAVSTEKSVALPALSPPVSPDSLGIEGRTLDFNQFANSLPSLRQQSAGEPEEILNKEINHQNDTKHSGFAERVGLVHSQTFLSSSFSNTLNHTESILNNSQIKSFSSNTETDMRSLAEISSATRRDTEKQLRLTYPGETFVTERPISTTTALYRSSKSLYTVRKPVKNGKQEMFGEKVNVGDPQSNLMYFSENKKNASHSASVDFKNVFIQSQPSGPPVSNSPAPHSSQASVLQEGSDHSNASHPTTRMSLTEAYGAKTPFSLSRSTTSAVKNPESKLLTERTDSLISAPRSKTLAKPSSPTKEPISTLLAKVSAIHFASSVTKRYLADKRDSQTSNTVRSIAKQSFVDAAGPANEEPQTPTFATRKLVPEMLFLAGSRQDFGDDVSVMTLTTPSSKSFSKKATAGRLLETQSTIIQDRTLDVNDKPVALTSQSFAKYSDCLIRDSLIVNNLNLGDEQVFTAVSENEDKDLLKMEGKQGEAIQERKEILKLQEEDESREDETDEKGEELFRLHRTESTKQEKIINIGAEINPNTDREAKEMEEHDGKTSGEEGGRTTAKEDVTLRQDKDQTEGEVSDGKERKVVIKINTENSTKEAAKQRESLTTEEANARSKEASSKECIKCNGEIGKENMTNVSLGPTTALKELNRDKGHTVKNLSACHSLIKQLGSTEQKGIHLGESTAQIVENTNKSFSDQVTSNHRPPGSTRTPKLSKTTSLSEEPKTEIKPHQSTLGALLPKRGTTSSLTKGSSQNQVVAATFFVTARPKLLHIFDVSSSKFQIVSEPTISLHSGAAKPAHPALNSISNMLSLTTAGPAITAGFTRAQSRFRVKSSTLNISIIYSIPDLRHKFSASDSKASSGLRTTTESEQAEFIAPSVNLSTRQQTYNDSSSEPPTATALSHISIGQLQPHEGQSAPQISQPSFSFDMTGGQPCSFKLSEQTTRPDALHAPVDDNEHRSVQTLMASMSPKAENDQFPLSRMSALVNLRLLGGDSLPGTYGLTGLTRSASVQKILREYANSGSDHAESLLGTVDETNQNGENDSMRMMVTSKVTDIVTKQIAEEGGEKNSSTLISQTNGSSTHRANSANQLNSLSIMQNEKLWVKKNNESNQNDLINIDRNDEANNTVTTTLKNNHPSQLGSTLTVMPLAHTPNKTEPELAINEDFVHVMNEFAIPVLDTNDPAGTPTLVESESLPEMTKMQANDVTNNAISDTTHHSAERAEKQNDPLSIRSTVSSNTLPVPLSNFTSDLTVLRKTTQQTSGQIMKVTSHFQIITTKTDGFVSLAAAASIGGLTVSAEDHESPLTTGESVSVISEKSSQATHADHMGQSSNHIETLPLSEPPITPTSGKLTPAVKRKNTTETQSVEQPDHEISVQAIEQSQHALPAMLAITCPINDPERGVQAGLLKTTHRAGEARGTSTTVKREEYSLLEDIKTTTKSAFEVKHPLHESISAAQHKEHLLPEKTSISQAIFRAVTDSITPTKILPTEVIHTTSCRTIDCAESGDITETTETTVIAGETDLTEKMYKTQAGNNGRDHLSAENTPDAKPDDRGSDCPPSGKVTPEAADPEYAVLSPATTKSDHGHASAEETASNKAGSVTDKTVHLERHRTPEQAPFVRKTSQRLFHKGTSDAQEVTATEVTLSEPEATAVQTTVKTTKQTPVAGKNTKTQLNRGTGNTEIFEAQNATRSVLAAAKEEMVVQESGQRLLIPESELERPGMKHGRRTSPHLYLSGVTEVSDDLCGSGNYTAEMNLGGGVEPGDTVPALGNLRVVINLKTNNSQLNLEVTSCCLSPTSLPDLSNSTCCLFSRLAAEPAGITLLPSALSTSASFTISLFQMINYSVVYLHCDLSVCLRNHSDCERQCLQQRSTFPLEGPRTIVTNLRNRISFGPMLKQVKNSTFSEEIDPSELDLALVIVSMVAGSSLVTVMLLLVWLAYHRRAIWLLHSAAQAPACCGCLHPGGDLILP